MKTDMKREMEHLLSLPPIPFLPTFTPVSLLINFCPQSRFPNPNPLSPSQSCKMKTEPSSLFLSSREVHFVIKLQSGNMEATTFDICPLPNVTGERLNRQNNEMRLIESTSRDTISNLGLTWLEPTRLVRMVQNQRCHLYLQFAALFHVRAKGACLENIQTQSALFDPPNPDHSEIFLWR